MKADILIENLTKNTPLIARVLPTHIQIPVLSNILVEAKKEGLYLSVTDLEIGVRIKIPAKVEETGMTTVPGRQFVEIINSLPKDKIQIRLEKDACIIECRGNQIRLQTISSEEFPQLMEKKGEQEIVFEKEEFKEIFSKLIFAVSQDEARPVLTGILVSQTDNQTVFVATDGFRLSLQKTEKKVFGENGGKLVLSSRLISEILFLKTEKKNIAMSVLQQSNQVVLEMDDILMVGRLIEGEFPNYERVIPAFSKTRIIINGESLEQAMRTVSVFAKESANIVRFRIEDGVLKLSSRATGLGEGEMNLEAEQEGEGNEIAFNGKFVLDFLKCVKSKGIMFEMNSSLEPGVFRPEDGNNFLHVIMPVRVQE